MTILRELTFESGVLIGTDAFDSVFQGVSLLQDRPIVGNYSVRMSEGGDTSLANVNFDEDQSNVHVAFYLRPQNATGATANIFRLNANAPDQYAITLRMDPGDFRLSWQDIHGNPISTIDPQLTQLVARHTYRIEISYINAGSGNATATLAIAKRDEPAIVVGTLENITDTHLIRGATWRVPYRTTPWRYDIDHAVIDDASMPVLPEPAPDPVIPVTDLGSMLYW